MEAITCVASVALLATTILLHSSPVAAAGTAHIVGGSTGWTIPPNTSFYSDWSSRQTIASGDTLVFNFPTGFHTVVEVPKLSFDSCSTTKQIGSTIKNGPATVTVTSGTHYYICSIPQHCSAGMKMAITVAAAAGAPSVSAAPPTGSRAAPAPAKGAAGTANSPAPLSAPISTANPPAAPGPSGSGNGSNSSAAFRGAAGLVVALLTVATVSFLL